MATSPCCARALDVNLKAFGENSGQTVESLRALAGLYESRQQWDKAEPFLLRGVKANEVASGEDAPDVLIPLWGLCDLYNHQAKPGKSQPCWHRATGLMEKQYGDNSPNLVTSLTNEANALRLLGRKEDADQLDERLRKIHRTVQTN